MKQTATDVVSSQSGSMEYITYMCTSACLGHNSCAVESTIKHFLDENLLHFVPTWLSNTKTACVHCF